MQYSSGWWDRKSALKDERVAFNGKPIEDHKTVGVLQQAGMPQITLLWPRKQHT